MRVNSLWDARCSEVRHFITVHHRLPSPAIAEEIAMWHWLRDNEERYRNGLLAADRAAQIQYLLSFPGGMLL